jgi:anti-anti-sigma factor
MDNGNVLHASRDDVHVLRYIGDIRYTLSPSIDRYLDEIFARSEPTGFVIDLTETDSIDSTNLGLLARLATRMQRPGAGRVTVVSSRPDINAVLNSMALDEVFDIVEDTCLETDATRQVPQESTDRETLARTLIDAHRALMDLNEHNREMFSDVVTTLEKNASSG